MKYIESPHTTQLRERFYGQPSTGDMPEPPEFCRCGRSLIRHEEIEGYRTDNGLPNTVTTIRCPKTLGWWNRGFLIFMSHDEYEPDRFIDWYWHKRYYR